MFERVLVPLDGSPLAEEALNRVAALLRSGDSEILLVRAAAEGEEDAYLERQERKLTRQGFRVRRAVRSGPPAEVILELAEGLRATMIAMSTHGRSGISRWVFGSVAEKVLRASRIPLLLVRSFGAKPLAFRTLLVPIDAGDASLEVLPVVAGLARRYESRVLLVHVCGGPLSCSIPVPHVTRAHEMLRREGIQAEPVLRMGDPAEQILEACREGSADAIAMTTHGRIGASRWVLGSVAEKVVRAADVPTIVVRKKAP